MQMKYMKCWVGGLDVKDHFNTLPFEWWFSLREVVPRMCLGREFQGGFQGDWMMMMMMDDY